MKRLDSPVLVGLAVLTALAPLRAQEGTPAAQPGADTTPGTTQTEPTPTPQKKRRFQLGPEFGVFQLLDSRTKNRFGGTKWSIGLGFTPIGRPTSKGQLSPDFRLMSFKRGNNKALWAPIGAKYTKSLVAEPETARYVPYAGAALGVVPARIKAPDDGVDENFKVGFGGSVFVGSLIGPKAYVELRLFGTTRIAGYNFSGVGLGGGFRF
jgi:hypothetical protein